MLSKNQFNPGLLFRLSSFFSPLGKDVELALFFNAWEELLATVLSRCDMVGSDVAEMTLVEVLRLLSEIKNDVRLLTIQLDSKFAEEVSFHVQVFKQNCFLRGVGMLSSNFSAELSVLLQECGPDDRKPGKSSVLFHCLQKNLADQPGHHVARRIPLRHLEHLGNQRAATF